MKKINIQIIQNNILEDALLKIKDESLTIIIGDKLIKIPYTDIKDYNYDNEKEQLTLYKHGGGKVVLGVGNDIDLFNKLTLITNTDQSIQNIKNGKEKTDTNSEQNNSNSVEKIDENSEKNNTLSIIGAVAIIIMVGFMVYFLVHDNNTSNSTTIVGGSWAEKKALEEVPEDAFYWGTPKPSELSCKAQTKTSDDIILVKCTSSIDEIKEHYGSSTIWYGYLQSADGNSYWHYSSASKDTVLSKLRD